MKAWKKEWGLVVRKEKNCALPREKKKKNRDTTSLSLCPEDVSGATWRERAASVAVVRKGLKPPLCGKLHNAERRPSAGKRTERDVARRGGLQISCEKKACPGGKRRSRGKPANDKGLGICRAAL